MALPVLTLDEAAFAHNTDKIFRYVHGHGAALAPHAKTPMSPQIVQRLLDAGAWGATVANLQQAAVLLRAGVRRLMLGNEIGGLASGARLGRLLAAYPDARLLAFADSADTVRALAAAAGEAGRPVDVLVEVGGGRARATRPACAPSWMPCRPRAASCRWPAWPPMKARSPRPTPRPRAAISRP